MGISIIICTYNPNLEILNLCFQSLDNQEIDGFEVEGIIIDNNSSTPLNEVKIVQEFLKRNPTYRVIRELNPGLTNARIAGYKAAKYNLLTFIDDDNGPEKDYFKTVFRKFNENPKLGALGPGHISVQFIPPYEKWVLDFKHAFQEKHIDGHHIDNDTKWLGIYPPGTGLTVRKLVFDKYNEFVESGNSSITDRVGKSLASGGDIQLVISGIKMGYYAGIDGELKMNHLIYGHKANLPYLKRVAFGCASSFPPCYLEMFPKKKEARSKSLLPSSVYNRSALRFILSPKTKIWTKQGQRDAATFIGNIVGFHRAVDRKVSRFLNFLIRILKLE
jgi:glycosyltransferase involved in cell wall biosynthesis